MRLPGRIGAFEFDGDAVRLAVVRTGAGAPNVVACHEARVDPALDRGEALVAGVVAVVQELKKRPSVFVLCAAGQMGVVRSLRIPFKGRAKVAAAVPFELEQYLAVPLEDLAVDHVHVREVGGETDVLAVGMRRDPLAEQLEALQAAGITIEGIGLDAIGLTALWQCGKPKSTGLNAVLHLRETGALLVVIHNKTLAYYRPIPIPASRALAAPETLAREVQNSLRGFRAQWDSESAIEDLSLTGCDDSGLAGALEEALGVPIRTVQLSETVRGRIPLTTGNANVWEGPIGSAVAAAGGVSYGLDFLRGDLVSTNPMKAFAARAAFSFGLFMVVLIGYSGYCIVDYRQNMAELNRIGNEIWAVFAETFPNDEAAKQRPPNDLGGIITARLMSERHEDAADTGPNLAMNMLSRTPLLDIIAEINTALPEDSGTIKDVIIRQSRTRSQKITIVGEVSDIASYEKMLAALRQSDIIQIDGEPTLRSAGTGKTEFTIAGQT